MLLYIFSILKVFLGLWPASLAWKLKWIVKDKHQEIVLNLRFWKVKPHLFLTTSFRIFGLGKPVFFWNPWLTGCSLNIVFCLKILWFFWTLPVLQQRWFSTCLLCVHKLTPRENRVRNILKNSEKNTIFNEHPVFAIDRSFTNANRYFSTQLCFPSVSVCVHKAGR